MTPLLGGQRLLAAGEVQPSLLDLPNVALVSQGRAAIALALECHSIGSGDDVLLPAFNCPAMTAAVRAARANPVFFPVQEDLQIRPEDVLAAATKSTKAVLIPHFFAWRQPRKLFERLKAETSWLVIEDCAHAFFGAPDDDPMGSLGHVGIGSIAKFFPSRWGGVLASADRQLSVRLDPSTAFVQLKLLANSTEASADFGRFGLASRPIGVTMRAISAVRRAFASADVEVEEAGESRSRAEAFGDVDLGRLHEEAGWWPAHMLRDKRTFGSRASQRLQIFARLSTELQDLRHGRQLLEKGSPDFPPYVLPLILDDPETQFSRLREAAVPMYRWEYSAKDICPVTDRYRWSLIQLPCHDSLSNEQMDSIVREVCRVLA